MFAKVCIRSRILALFGMVMFSTLGLFAVTASGWGEDPPTCNSQPYDPDTQQCCNNEIEPL